MRYKYDKGADILVIGLGRHKPDFAKQSGNVIAHYDQKTSLSR